MIKPLPRRCAVLVGALALCMDVAAVSAGQSYELSPARRPGAIVQAGVRLSSQGKLLVTQEGKQESLPMKVEATMLYEQRCVADHPQRWLAVRRYQRADVNLEIDGAKIHPKLRDDRRVVVIDTNADESTLYARQGELSREELDLLNVPAANLPPEWLLPGEAKKIGDAWKHAPKLLATLLSIDAVSASDVQSVLSKVDDKTHLARIEIAGHVDGAADGVATEIELKGHWTFDLQNRLVRDLRLTIKEKRAMGHVGPGLDVTSQFGARYASIQAPKLLKPADWQGVTPDTRPADELLSFRSQIAGYRFHHGRDWHILDERPNILVLRLVQRGELVAQANISPLAPDAAKKPLDLDAFQSEVKKALGKNFGKVIAASEAKNPAGLRVFRVVVQGDVNTLNIQWNYYLVSDTEGHQLSLVFTFERDLAKRFQHADKVIVDSLRIEPNQTRAAKSQRPAAASPRR